jgi:cytoskeletal protein RodZ
MQTIGEYIKSTRDKKRLSIKAVEKGTKIKSEFISAIEKEDWEKLPEYPVVVGFVKNIATYLSEDPEKAAALLRRDYPPKKLEVNPKPDISKKFVWSPKITFAIAVSIVIILILSYLGFQYVQFIKPPTLEISSPSKAQVVTQKDLVVEGVTDMDASIIVNNQPVIVDDEGYFTAEIEVVENTKEIIITARSRSGKETIEIRQIEVNLVE